MEQNILVVEDNFDCCEALVDVLQLSGIQAMGVTSAKEAIQKMTDSVTTILIDYQLESGVTGLELAEIITSHYKVQVVIMSGLPRLCPPKFKFFTKPIDVDHLVNFLQRT